MRILIFIAMLCVAAQGRGQIYINSYAFGAGADTLLLDLYPNAAAAYSLRKVRTAYTGNCVTVRRSSNGDTTNIGFVNNYLDTTTLKTFCSGTSCFIVTWFDQSGNNINARQATAGDQPRIVNSGTLDKLSGLVDVNFISADFFPITITLNDTVTIFSVHEDGTQDASGSLHKTIFGTNTDQIVDNSTGYNYNKLREGANGFSFYFPSTGIVTNNGILINYTKTSAQELVFAVNNQAVAELWKNNVSQGSVTGNNRTSGFTSGYNIGRANATDRAYTGGIQELIIYRSNQTSNRSGIQTNLNTFYTVY